MNENFYSFLFAQQDKKKRKLHQKENLTTTILRNILKANSPLSQ